MEDYISIWDFVLAPVFLLIIYRVSLSIQNRNIERNPIYKYYITGLFLKLFGAIAVCFIYVYYYGGGDTIGYFSGSRAMINLLFKDPSTFISIMAGNLTPENFSMFDSHTWWPPYYMWRDEKTFFVIRFSTLLVLVSGKLFIPATMLLAWGSYSGIWRLYEMFCEKYKQLAKQLAIAILFMPSVVFWGSGMLKDTITLSATCWFTYAIYQLIVNRNNMLLNLAYMAISSFLLLAIKPYIFVALMPGVLLWISHERISKIKSMFLKIIGLPVILGIAALTISLVFSQLGDSLGLYSDLDSMLVKAETTRSDLVRAQYGTHSYDIGVIDPSLSGLLGKAPVAIVAALFRPFLWEAGNIVMLLSAFENTFVLLLTLFLIFRYGPISIVKYVSTNPLLLFTLSFSIFFAFAVGLTTANFGALVRYKIPAIPFFLSSLFILYYHLKSGDQKQVNS